MTDKIRSLYRPTATRIDYRLVSNSETDPVKLQREIKRLTKRSREHQLKRAEAEGQLAAAQADNRRLATHIDQLRSENARLSWLLKLDRQEGP